LRCARKILSGTEFAQLGRKSVIRQSHFPNSRGELNMSVPSVRRSMESSLGANVSAFVDIEKNS
jgi:hypothetical protein